MLRVVVRQVENCLLVREGEKFFAEQVGNDVRAIIPKVKYERLKIESDDLFEFLIPMLIRNEISRPIFEKLGI